MADGGWRMADGECRVSGVGCRVFGLTPNLTEKLSHVQAKSKVFSVRLPVTKGVLAIARNKGKTSIAESVKLTFSSIAFTNSGEIPSSN